MTIEFKAWPKTPRLFREIVVTEKVDGTNSAVIIQESDGEAVDPNALATLKHDGVLYEIAAQSRNRLIFPGKTTDNHGFASFVQYNAEHLFDLLGPGRHYGEWWGSGIQGRYKFNSSDFKGFALFNTEKHKGLYHWLANPTGGQALVEPSPILYEGPFSEQKIRDILESLKKHGSVISPSDPAEGIVVYHTQSRQVFKVTLDGNDAGKWEAV